jgi:hypothetical protein
MANQAQPEDEDEKIEPFQSSWIFFYKALLPFELIVVKTLRRKLLPWKRARRKQRD